MNAMKRMIVVLLMMSIMPLCAMEQYVMENGEGSKYIVTITSLPISDQELSRKKNQYATHIQNVQRCGESVGCETIYFPRDAHIDVDVQALNKELGLPHTNCIYRMTGNEFWVPKGLDPRFISKTLKPEKR